MPGLTFGALSSIETGRLNKEGMRRRHITVDEWLVIARALDVPPVVLLCPLSSPDIEVLPGVAVHPWRAAAWVTAEASFPPQDGHVLPPQGREHEKVQQLRRHDLAAAAWHAAHEEMRLWTTPASGAPSAGWTREGETRYKLALDHKLEAERELKVIRARLADLRVTAPELPPLGDNNQLELDLQVSTP